MQIVQKSKRILSILLVITLCFALCAAFATTAQAEELLPGELYMEQSRGGICTMTSAAMLLRSALYMNGNSHWSEIGESEAANACWLWGSGILFAWSFETDYAKIDVERTELSGISVDELKAVLDAHPEGIEFYCGGVPHAVFLTDYEGDTFYCADPAPYCSGKRVPISESWLGYRLGLGNQDAVLRNATAYWSIVKCDVDQDLDEAPIDDVLSEQSQAKTLTAAKQLLRQDQAWIIPEILALGA